MECPKCGGIGRVDKHIIGGNYWRDVQSVRLQYARSYEVITTPKELSSTLRSGEEFFLCHGGGILHRKCVLENYRVIISSIKDHRNDGWRVIGLPGPREEWTESHCAHCGREL